jgi:hypothetical protein
MFVVVGGQLVVIGTCFFCGQDFIEQLSGELVGAKSEANSCRARLQRITQEVDDLKATHEVDLQAARVNERSAVGAELEVASMERDRLRRDLEQALATARSKTAAVDKLSRQVTRMTSELVRARSHGEGVGGGSGGSGGGGAAVGSGRVTPMEVAAETLSERERIGSAYGVGNSGPARGSVPAGVPVPVPMAMAGSSGAGAGAGTNPAVVGGSSMGWSTGGRQGPDGYMSVEPVDAPSGVEGAFTPAVQSMSDAPSTYVSLSQIQPNIVSCNVFRDGFSIVCAAIHSLDFGC